MTDSPVFHPDPTFHSLDERSQQLLKTLIERYIRDGEPIGSRTLLQDSLMDLSPATIRHVMADLEGMGLVRSPHTSAGRIPTAKGYRVFVDTMLNIKPLHDVEIESLKLQLGLTRDNKTLLKSASTVLSDITRFAGLVMVPRPEAAALRQVEFLPLSNRRVLALLIVNDKEIQNRVVHVDRDYSRDELQQAANFINAHFSGRDLGGIQERLRHDLLQAQEQLNHLMKLVIEMSGQVFSLDPQQTGDDLFVDGQTNLMNVKDLSDMEKLKQLFEAFNKKRDILHLLDRCQQADGVQIYIGQESGYQALDDCSVITAPYSVGGEVIGVLGVVGPTRMAYDRVIPIVDITAKLLSAALSEQS
ncbi:MAG: heat-inducible transcriptional repressor HrcA [Gammaproteobacteria bacterium]|nr:heat-inducible transcriptional repressor HrcA [Gammaproteobacteria bacterium]